MKNSSSRGEETASESTGKKREEPGDWRGKTLEEARRIIMEADLEIVEEVKWKKPSYVPSAIGRKIQALGSHHS